MGSCVIQQQKMEALLTRALCGGNSDYPHFIAEDTEAQREQVTWPRSTAGKGQRQDLLQRPPLPAPARHPRHPHPPPAPAHTHTHRVAQQGGGHPTGVGRTSNLHLPEQASLPEAGAPTSCAPAVCSAPLGRETEAGTVLPWSWSPLQRLGLWGQNFDKWPHTY